MEDLIPDHKLCGFLTTVLAINSSHGDDAGICKTLNFGTSCQLFGNGSEVGFRSENGVVMSPIDSNPKPSTHVEVSPGKFRSSGKSSRKGKKIGLVNGGSSVVHQLHSLVMRKCLKIVARVVRVGMGDNGGAGWAMVLVDVFLPMSVWSGRQFPRSGSMAVALFRHLSCDWAERRSILVRQDNQDNSNYAHAYNKGIGDLPDCYVLGCKLHCDIPDSKKKLFELHEIFKSLPSVGKEEIIDSFRVEPADASCRSGIWDLTDDLLTNILTALGPLDLVRASATCHHLRSLTAAIMPCMKLKLFPHQQAAVEWMLHRERGSEVLRHPLYMDFVTEDGFSFHINTVSGEIVTGIPPTTRDFRGGMFCDEPGLGKTITTLSLILKTQGTLADPPDGVQVIWCTHNADTRCGYYEVSSDNDRGQNVRRGQFSLGKVTPKEDLNHFSTKRARLMGPDGIGKGAVSLGSAGSVPTTCVVRCTRNLSRIKRNLFSTCEGAHGFSRESRTMKNSSAKKRPLSGPGSLSLDKRVGSSRGLPYSSKRRKTGEQFVYNETWVQCDACRKWRKLVETSTADADTAWFCSMNSDPLHQSCSVPEQSWDKRQPITYFPGFYTKETTGGMAQNVSFFTNVLKEHYTLMNTETKKALTWLAKLSPEKLSEMETNGLTHPVFNTQVVSGEDAPCFHKIFQALGLVKKPGKGTCRWYYPRTVKNKVFDLAALRIALCKPLDSFRLYLSRATLVVVPSNLVDHWKTQIQKHVRPEQLRVYLWTDHKKPPVHNLAWDFDIVITTFSRLSAEWSPRKRSALMQVHWLRVILDEGHTLGSSLNLTNKLQMALSLTASNRWLLTGTPTPNTPSNQLSHLQPMLKFLHEETYGHDQKSWEAGILRPFEAEMEDGRSRLLQLLHRCMISARKIDLKTIPPCIKKVTFLDFTEEHAKSYNELVVTVRRNILMADWNDPSHVESLLNPKQWKFRSTTIKNVRLSCCVAGHIKVTDAGQDIQETMDILVGNGLDPVSEEYVLIKYYLLNGGSCMRCQEWCRLPVITPCRHLLCLHCVSLDSEKCTFPGCGNLYEMQTPDILARPENPNPKWPVPKDLIELQPSYKQDNWDPDWQSTSSSKVSYLVQRLEVLQEANKKIGYSLDVDSDKDTEELPESDLNASLRDCSKPRNESCEVPPEKVLIFSQFLEHIHIIEQQLTHAGIKFTGMYSPMHSGNKMKSLSMFQHDPNCMALVMDGSAALGLDLSFVTHVFLMEPIWDRSMEEQVISRAHRMGATRPIHVETLAMRGTIEEQMLEFLQDVNGCRRMMKEEFEKPERDGARVRRTLHDFAESDYLAHIGFVRTNLVD